MITSPQNYSLLLSPEKSQRKSQKPSQKRSQKPSQNHFQQSPQPQRQPPQIRKPKPKQKTQKDILIHKIQAANSNLKAQVYKIQTQIQQRDQYQRQLLQNISKRQSLFDSDNETMLQKQLQNVYKQIQFYEYQIKKLQQSSPNKVSLQSKRAQSQMIIRQKRQMLTKLKEKYIRQLKMTQDNDRRLKDSNLKETNDEEIHQLNNQIRVIKEKVVALERVEVVKKENMTKQYRAIKKIENELLEMGMAAGGLEEVKEKALRGIGGGNTDRRQKKINNSIIINNNSKTIQKKQKNHSIANINNPSKALLSQDQQYYQNTIPQKNDKSYQTYKRQTNQISLLDKMISDYQKMIRQGENERDEAIKLNEGSKAQLQECEHEIEKLQGLMLELKGRINPVNMKPIKQFRSMTTKPKDNPAKINQMVKMPIIVKNKSISHLLEHDEVGFPSDKGDKFTDRHVLGRSSLKAKILGAKVYISKASNAIVGLQMTYSGNKRGGDYFKKDTPQQLYTKQQFQCNRPNFIKQIYGTLNSQSKLSSIIFVSSNKIQYKYGALNVNSSIKSTKFSFQIQDNEYPTCLFGSLIIGKQNRREMSFFEYLGVEVQREDDRQDRK